MATSGIQNPQRLYAVMAIQLFDIILKLSLLRPLTEKVSRDDSLGLGTFSLI